VKMLRVQFQISAVLAGNWNFGVEIHPLRMSQGREPEGDSNVDRDIR